MKQQLTSKSVGKLSPSDKRYRVWDTKFNNLLIEVLPSGRKSWRLYYRHLGKPKFFTLGTFPSTTVEMARKRALEKAGEAENGHDLVIEKKELIQSNQQTLGSFINNTYIDFISDSKSADYTIESLKRDFGHWYKIRLQDFTPSMLDKWKSNKLRSGIKPITIKRCIAPLLAVFRKAFKEGVIQKNPLNIPLKDIIDVPTEDRVRFLKPQEDKALMDALPFSDDWFQCLVVLAKNTGMRRGELFTLTWQDIDLDEKEITVKATNAKSNKTRKVPLNQKAIDAVNSMCEIKKRREESDRKELFSTNLVFPSPQTGQKLITVKSAWKTLMKNSGITDFRFHDLRHHFASMLVKNGIGILVISKILGHYNISMTEKYAHVGDKEKHDAVNLI